MPIQSWLSGIRNIVCPCSMFQIQCSCVPYAGFFSKIVYKILRNFNWTKIGRTPLNYVPEGLVNNLWRYSMMLNLNKQMCSELLFGFHKEKKDHNNTSGRGYVNYFLGNDLYVQVSPKCKKQCKECELFFRYIYIFREWCKAASYIQDF